MLLILRKLALLSLAICPIRHVRDFFDELLVVKRYFYLISVIYGFLSGTFLNVYKNYTIMMPESFPELPVCI